MCLDLARSTSLNRTTQATAFGICLVHRGNVSTEGSPFQRKPTRLAVEKYLALQLKEFLSRLEKECERNRIGQEELDEAVHEAAQMNNTRLSQTAEGRKQERLISAAEAEAARINNGGCIHQLAYLFEVY